ncbi:MAG: sulfatase-like hydrolase/transferase [Phycisphaerae bacterium]
MKQNRPNILLLTSDQQRYDTLGCNGNKWVRTPHLDALAAGGVNFQRAFIQNTVCIPSRACLQTGRYIHQHGCDYMEDIIDDTPGLPAWEITFMERLQAAGYKTAAYGKLHMMPHKGFHHQQVCGGKGVRWTKSAGQEIGLGPLGRDYAAWLEAKHPGAYEMIYTQRREQEWKDWRGAITNVLPLEEYVDYWCTENTIKRIKASKGAAEPFFIWCGFCGPHDPMDPPKPYDKLYPYDSIPLPPNYHYGRDGKPRTTTPQEDAVARRFISHYYGQITLIDDMVGRIVEALKETGQLDDTLIIYTSDHGEMLWEFNRTGKVVFNESVLRVPFIVVPPATAGHASANGNSAEAWHPLRGNTEEMVEIFDLAPTILDYARAGVPPIMAARTLRPILEGAGRGRDVALCQFVASNRAFKGICLRTKGHKYVQWSDARGDEFYDLDRDPLERTNLINDPASRELVEQHRRLLVARLMETGNRM